MILQRSVRVGLFVLAAVCVGCESMTSPEATSLSLTVGGDSYLVANVGDTISLTVTTMDGRGRIAPDLAAPVFVSRNPSVASVDSTGAVASNSAGSTFVVATETAGSRILSDSIPVEVAVLVEGDVSAGTR